MSRITALICSLALGFGALIAPASAATVDKTQTVSFAELNLNSEDGAEAMLYRIRHAARSVCGDQHGVMRLEERRAIRACRAEAEQRAVSDLNHPMVTAMYYGREPTIIVASAN